MGTLSRIRPSGISSPSSSSHSCSRSARDFRSRLLDCQLPLLGFGGRLGPRGFKEMPGLGLLCRCDVNRLGVEWLLDRRIGETGRVGSVRTVRLVLRGLEMDRRFGNEDCGLGARVPEASVRTPLGSGEEGEGALSLRGRLNWEELVMVASSSRPMSSKWPMSPPKLPSSLRRDDWNEEDLELLEPVIPGGELGVLGAVSLSSGERIMTAWQCDKVPNAEEHKRIGQCRTGSLMARRCILAIRLVVTRSRECGVVVFFVQGGFRSEKVCGGGGTKRERGRQSGPGPDKTRQGGWVGDLGGCQAMRAAVGRCCKEELFQGRV